MNSTAETSIKLVIADSHSIFREGIRSILKKQKQPAVELIGETEDGNELISLVKTHHPDIVVMDVALQNMSGLEACRLISHHSPATSVLILSDITEENMVFDLLNAGAKGWLLRTASAEEIAEAMRTIYQGERYYCAATSKLLLQTLMKAKFDNDPNAIYFNDNERKIIELICAQLSTKEIAAALSLSTRTIDDYRRKIEEKIGAKNGVGIALYAVKNNIVKV